MFMRRRALRWIAGAGALSLIGCGGGSDDSSSTASSSASSSTATVATTTTATTVETTTATTGTTTCATAPEETAGPYPGDGSNTANGTLANALMLSGIVRSDIRTSIAGATGTAQGIQLTSTIKLVNARSDCASLEGYAIYLWHCTREGEYSMYSSSVSTQNFLRGVQQTDANGTVTFTTIFPGCYSGRMPHMHFEVYRTPTTATSYSNKLLTSQIAFPVATCNEAYATTGYSASVRNLAAISFATDNVFSDNAANGTLASETCAVTGSPTAGYTATLTVGISI